MAKECAGGRPPKQNTNSYTLTKAEFASIFGGGNDTVVQDFFYYDGDIPKVISLPQGFCNINLGEYEDISNLEILTSLLLIGGVVTTAIALLLPYLKILRNVERFLQEARVCDCQKATATEPLPIPPSQPDPNPNDPPPDTCCTECFQTYFEIIQAANIIDFANMAAFEAAHPEVERGESGGTSYNPPVPWTTLGCSEIGFPCQIFEYTEDGGIYVYKETGVPFTQGQFQQTVTWGTGRKLLYRDFCDKEPQPTPTPTPKPKPLPPDNFDFCEQFPALCNACPDVGNSQDVVVSGKIASTCAVKDDISFNVKF